VNAPTKVPFSDLAWQWRLIEPDVMPEMHKLFDTSAYTLGWAVDRFETNFAAYIGSENAVGVSSGTSALHLAVIAAGIGPGDKVLLPAHTFIATAWAVVYVGAEPILCDVEPDTGNIDIADAERRMQPGVKAIIPVHLYGQPADMKAVTAFAARHGLAVIEDCAQAHGARYDGRIVGTFGDFGCFSFYPGKNLGAAGESGAVTTASAAAAAQMKSLRNHGQEQRYTHTQIGFNYRMEGIQGLILDHKLKHLAAWTDERRALAKRYLAGLEGLPLGLPQVVHGDHVYHLFVVRTPQRDALKAYLEAQGVETGLHYPIPLHRQPCFDHYAFDRDSYPVADTYATQCLSLPLYAGMKAEQVETVISVVQAFFKGG
jgi:dTDP-4-amino-4,6-dideoxygalactose transaminase